MKKILFTLLLGCCATILHAQTAASCFKALPDSLSPLLSAVNRADCIDFIESDMRAEVTNAFGGKSEMTQLSPDYIRMKMTAQSSWQMKLLPVNDSTKVICTVFTACVPACDSHLRFYSTEWEELPAEDYFSVASLPDSGKYMLLKEALLSPDEPLLTFTLTTPDYIEEEGIRTEKPSWDEPVVYLWTGGRFEKRE